MLKKFLTLLAIYLVSNTLYSQVNDSIAENAISEYLNSTGEKHKMLEKKIEKINPPFDQVFLELKQGKKYSSGIKKGFFEHNFKNTIGIEHPNLVFIPFSYNPNKKYQVRIFLHGAVSSLDLRQIYSLVNRADTSWRSVNTICLFPASWLLSKWWSYKQYENLSELLNWIKGNYNVDENNVFLTGVSDGASGIFYLSNFYQNPFSCFLPYIGGMHVLTALTDKQFYIKNYQGLNFFIVNGCHDEIFNIDFAIKSVNELKKYAKDVKFIVIDSAKHNIRWYPVLKDSIKNFISTHPRNPYPDQIYYASESCDTFNRKFWVLINKFGYTKDESNLDDQNFIQDNGKKVQLFPRNKAFGQIELEKKKNIVSVFTKNIRKYTLLISPEHFDISKPITIYTNNKLSYEGIVPKNIKVLLKYYSLDNDREMLFSAELPIIVGREFKTKN